MDYRATELERAFQLAKSGNCVSIADIRDRLKKEGYSLDRVTGKFLITQLKALLQTANEANTQPRP
jgi:hypothetical protein